MPVAADMTNKHFMPAEQSKLLRPYSRHIQGTERHQSEANSTINNSELTEGKVCQGTETVSLKPQHMLCVK